jgi:lysophospholipid acyltransferase (LPLAT)-like uncharacterized protein
VQLPSWDRQRVPLLFARVELTYGLVNVAQKDAATQLSSVLSLLEA